MTQQDTTCLPTRLEDQRAGSRTATVFRPVVIEAAESVCFALVRNLSAEGMRAKVCARFLPGGPITVRFGSHDVIRGAVIWCDGDHIGVRFEQVIDVAQVLANLSKKVLHGRLNRALRLPIRSTGELLVEGRNLTIEVQDISLRGLKVLTSFLRPGDEVSVCLEGLDRKKAEVRWTEEGMAGLNFLCPLSFDELARWTVGRRMTAAIGVSQDLDSRSVLTVQRSSLRRAA